MIQQPTNITPSSFGSLGNGVVDLSGGTLDVTWQINGESPLYAYQIDFYDPADLEHTVYSTGKQSITPVWGRSYTGDYVPYTASLSGISTMTNGNAYVFTIKQWYGSGAGDYVNQIQPSYFVTRTTPTISIVDASTGTTVANPYVSNEITLQANYSQAQNDTLNWFRWVIQDEDLNTIHDSGKVYGTGNISCSYDGLFTGQTYTATIEIETCNGQTATATESIVVSYSTETNTGAIEVKQGDSFVRVSWDSLQQIFGEPTGDYTIANGSLYLPNGSDVLWDEMNGQSFDQFDKFDAPYCWAWCGTIQTTASTKVFSIYGTNASDTLDYYLGNNQLILKQGGTTINTVSVPVGISETFVIAQSRTNLYIYRLYGTGGLTPDVDLEPDSTLTPATATDTAVGDYSTTTTDQNFDLMGVQVWGACIHHYIWFASGNISADTLAEIADVPTEPTETSSDIFYCNFENDLNAGSLSDYASAIEGWSIYRQSATESVLRHIADLDVAQSFVNDFSAVSQTAYTYYVFPFGATTFVTNPLVSEEFVPIWWCYTLITAEEQSDGYTYIKQDAFKFGLNVSTGAMSNNNTPSVLQNFTGVPYIQISPDNYITGQLSALIGRVKDDTYYDSVPLRDAIMALSTYTGSMFLKDRKGSIWKVRPNAPISIQTADRTVGQNYSVTLSWVQIEQGNNFSVIGTTAEHSGYSDGGESADCDLPDADGEEF